jgi:hypothetical protein
MSGPPWTTAPATTTAGTERCRDDVISDTTLATGQGVDADGTIRCSGDNVSDTTLAANSIADRLAEMCDSAAAPTSYQYPCWVDKEPGPVVAAVEVAIVRGLADYYADPNAPYAERAPCAMDIDYGLDFYLACDKCPRPAQSHLGNLGGLRLGAHERRLLLAAPLPNAQPVHLKPLTNDRSGYEAHQRARRLLEGAGLLHRYPAGHYGYPEAEGAILSRLSPLGAAVVEVCRPELETGRRIRWDRRRSAIELVISRYVCDPVHATRAHMTRYAADGRPHHYPAVTRYLLPALEEAVS